MTLLLLFSCTQNTDPVNNTVDKEPPVEHDTGKQDTGEPHSSNDTAHQSIDTSSPPTDTNIDSGSDTEEYRYDEAYFKSTHNSYSGEERGSITEQLNSGVRGLELDIHDNDFSSVGDYQIGHSQHGSEVLLGSGNPSSTLLSEWLNLIKDWSDDNPGHSPITITLDLKDNLTDNENHENGNLSRLNAVISECLGADLFKAQGFTEWPSVSELNNKFIVVLSGDELSRKLYKRDKGYNPAVAINDQGQVIEVHDSGHGNLWYWTGQLNSDGSISWKRHGHYDTGTTPAIDLNNEGWFVEVHQSHSATTLWSTVGYIDSDYNPIFFSSEEFDDGITPSIRFSSKDSFEFREIHQSQNTGLNWDWVGTLNTATNTINWTDHEQTSDQRYNKSRDEAGDWVEVSTGQHRNADSDTLLYTTASQTHRIRYEQLAFVEIQPGNAVELSDSEAWFYATGSGQPDVINEWNEQGRITRVWSYSESDINESLPNFPATDHPYEPWYSDFCEGLTVE